MMHANMGPLAVGIAAPVFDAVADANGAIAVLTEPPLRNAFDVGALVVWDHPRALFRRKTSTAQWNYEGALASDMMLDLLEDTRP